MVVQKKINRPLQEILEGRSTSMTIGPPGIPGLMSYLGRETQQGSGREDTGPSGRSPSQSDPSLRSEDNFKAVPLFTVVKTDDQGNAVADFIAPENVGSFVVRAYATSRKFVDPQSNFARLTGPCSLVTLRFSNRFLS